MCKVTVKRQLTNVKKNIKSCTNTMIEYQYHVKHPQCVVNEKICGCIAATIYNPPS